MNRLPLLCVGLLMMLGTTLHAQQRTYDWRLRFSAGTMSYYGDLSYQWQTDWEHIRSLSTDAYPWGVGLDLEKNLGSTFRLSLGGQYGFITGTDRLTRLDGTLVTDNPNFERALNFRTELASAQALIHFRLDNGWLFRQQARFSPYLFAGVGFTGFRVFGDLRDENADRYYYWTDGTIRNLAQDNPNVEQAEIISQDQRFETRLDDVATEEPAEYDPFTFTLPVGAGLDFRLSKRLNLGIRYQLTYTFTDYLDDVGGNYRTDYLEGSLAAYLANPSGLDITAGAPRANENGQTDWFGMGSISLSYDLGVRVKKFKAPWFYAANEQDEEEILLPAATLTPPATDSSMVMEDSLVEIVKEIEIEEDTVIEVEAAPLYQTNNYYIYQGDTNPAAQAPDSAQIEVRTIVQAPQQEAALDSLNGKLDRLEAMIVSISQQQGSAQKVAPDPQPDAQTEALEREVEALQRQVEALSRQPRQKGGVTYLSDPEDVAKIVLLESRVGELQKELAEVRAQEPDTVTISLPPDTVLIEKIVEVLPTQDSSAMVGEEVVEKPSYAANQLIKRTDPVGVPQRLDPEPSVPDTVEKIQVQRVVERDTLTRVDTLTLTRVDTLIQTRVDTQEVPLLLSGLGKTIFFFPLGKTSLYPADVAIADSLGAYMQRYPFLKAKITGFADPTGNAQTNLRLSQQRAESVAIRLRMQGIAEDRMEITFFGDERIRYGDGTLDRRVEVVLELE